MNFIKFKAKSTHKKEIKSNEEYEYIKKWVKRNHSINDLKSLFDFIYRKPDNEKFGEEPLKIAWENLSYSEQNYLTYELAKIYVERLSHLPQSN